MNKVKEKLAELIHDYNDACHEKVEKGKYCPRCWRLAGQVIIWASVELQNQGVKGREK